MADLELLVKARKYIRADITKTCNYVNSHISSMNLNEKHEKLAKLEALKVDVRDLDDKILSIHLTRSSDDEIQTIYDGCTEYQSKLVSALTSLKLSCESNPVLVPTVPISPAAELSRSQLKLPVLPLPEYGHKPGESLSQFLHTFDNIINKYNLTSYEKFLFLQNQLLNEPLTLIKSLKVEDHKYETARDLLQKAFASPIVQKYEVLKSLSCMSMSDSDDPYEYIGKMRSISDSFDQLSIDSKTILQYFFWHGMNSEFQNQLVQITNNSKPSLDEINTHVFEATERYMNAGCKPKVRPSVSSKKQTFVHAVDVDVGRRQYCSLCSSKLDKDFSHSTYKCPKYSSPNSKRDRLRSLNGCLKCANITHTTDNCKFKFRQKCHRCSKFHFSFLCTADSNQSSRVSNNSSKHSQNAVNNAVSTGTLWVGQVDVQNYGADAIVPTFSVCVSGRTLRVMRDSGCQPSLIKRSVANELNLSVVQDNFSVTINGVNDSDRIVTKIVSVPLYGNEIVNAICVPEIKTNIRLPNLSKIANHFIDKGYILADKTLTSCFDCINDLDVILGNNEAHVMPQTDVLFGKSPPSIYSETPAGIMLMGCVGRILNNLRYLPDLNREQASPSVYENSSTSSFVSENMVSTNYIVLGSEDAIDPGIMDCAAKNLVGQDSSVVKYEEEVYEGSTEENDRIVDYVLSNTSRDSEGRLVMPLIWNAKVCEKLSRNYGLSKTLLANNYNKLKRNPDYLKLYDSVIREQEDLGIIQRINNVDQYIKENPTCSFLPHMGVFKPDNETTKCRIVFLSNLAERNCVNDLSHNKVMLSGPNLNKKITTALMDVRFDRFLLCYDLKKAFLNIALPLCEQNKLSFLWYRNVEKRDFSIIAYKHLRLAFGLRCSPTILMLALYKILIIDVMGESEEDRRLYKCCYNLFYMDNGSYTTNDENYLKVAFEKINTKLSSYQFSLQKIYTNSSVQSMISPAEDSSDVKIFGINWNKTEDSLRTMPMRLNANANTKRAVLSSLNSNYDVFEINGPILNRARLFLHKMQCEKGLGWDDVMSDEQIHEWRNISRQVNSSVPFNIQRCIGRRDSTYELVAFTDASKTMYGVVLYLQDMTTSKVSFLLARNRIVNNQLQCKSVPALELQALTLGVETIVECYEELCVSNLCPIKVCKLSVYSDSMVGLSWVNSKVNLLSKMQKKQIFVLNRIDKICSLCDKFPIQFYYVAGVENPADCITRPLSYKQLVNSNYHSGPKFLTDPNDSIFRESLLSFSVPRCEEHKEYSHFSVNITSSEPLIPFDKYSSFRKLVRIYRLVRLFIHKCRVRISNSNISVDGGSLYECSMKEIIKSDQHVHFSDIFKFFSTNHASRGNIPNLISQLNLFIDRDGILRVGCKFDRWRESGKFTYPYLISKESLLVEPIVMDIHSDLSHAGCYSVLSEFRKQFHVPCNFSVIKKILKKCTRCKRMNARAVKLNQSSYRDFRADPPQTPFKYIFIDHCGPFYIKTHEKTKCWILVITCLWSRAINLKVCYDLTVSEFLRTFQLHIFDHGIPELVLSDLGSQFVAGADVITNLLNNFEINTFMEEKNCKVIKFEQYFKGCNELGSLVESMVKLIKKLIYSSIGKNVLRSLDFEFIVCQTIHMCNKRPIARRETLRASGTDGDFPSAITPELLLRGYELVSVDILPSHSQYDRDFVPFEKENNLKLNFERLSKIRNKMHETYHDEFLTNLHIQATNKRDRYANHKHNKLAVGDVVIVREQNMKRINFPLGKVEQVFENHLEEVTGAVIKKANGERIKRHASSLIKFISNAEFREDSTAVNEEGGVRKNPERDCAKRAITLNRNLFDSDLA